MNEQRNIDPTAGDRARSLDGKRIVVTRALEQAADLEDALAARGAQPLAYPCIAIAPPADTGPLDAALRGLAAGDFDWLVLSSTNAVRILAARRRELGLAAAAWPAVRLAAVGPATAEAAAAELDLAVDLLPETYVAESLSAALRERLQPGERVLLCQAELARDVLRSDLETSGAFLTAITAYRTVVGRGGIDLAAHLAQGQVDAILFTSSSTVRFLLQRLQAEGGRTADLQGVCLACLGPITAATATSRGLSVQVVPEQQTLPALLDALAAYFKGNL